MKLKIALVALSVGFLGCTVKPTFHLGDTVRVTQGFYAGCTGTLKEFNLAVSEYTIEAKCPSDKDSLFSPRTLLISAEQLERVQ